MDISLSAALKQIGEQFSFSMSGEFSNQEFGGRSIDFIAPVSVDGVFSYDGETVNVTAKVCVLLSSVCARCGKAFDEQIQYNMNETYVKASAYDPDSDTYPFSGDTLSLDCAVLDNLYLSLPIVSVCRSDCKGVCPVCGADRNVTECGCMVPDPSNPFSVLQSTFINDD